jgi:hypothetical protein
MHIYLLININDNYTMNQLCRQDPTNNNTQDYSFSQSHPMTQRPRFELVSLRVY